MDEVSQLVEKAQEGDKDAYGKIYGLFYKRIYRYCQFNLARQEVAQDICQETFLRAWRSLPRFSLKGGSFQAYLFKIAHNLIIDLSRKKKEFSIDNYQEVASFEQDLDENIIKEEDIKKVREAIDKLGDAERQIIILRYFEEMTSVEVAKVVGVRHGALRVRTHRILKKLKGILQND